jgi:hypothetical protein
MMIAILSRVIATAPSLPEQFTRTSLTRLGGFEGVGLRKSLQIKRAIA